MVAQAVDMRRTGAAICVVALHAVILMLFLRSTFQSTRVAEPVRELTLRLWHTEPTKPQETPRSATRVPNTISPPRAIAPVGPSPVPGASLNGLHQSLFGCAPENLGKLSPEARARCAVTTLENPDANAPANVLNLPSRAHDPARWQRALARKQNPLLLPCANFAMLPLAPFCLLKGAMDGFGDPDEAPGYGDAPGAAPQVPNGGDPPYLPARH